MQVGDRFIPVRSAMNWGVANYLLTHKPEPVMAVSPSKRLYSNLLKHALDIDTTRILAFHVKPPGSMQGHVAENYSCPIKLVCGSSDLFSVGGTEIYLSFN